MKNRKNIPLILYLLALVLLMSWAVGAFDLGSENLSYSDIVELFEKEQVKRFCVSGNVIELELHEPLDGETEIREHLADPESFRAEMNELLRSQKDQGILESYDFVAEAAFSPFDLVLPLLTVGIILLLIWSMIMARMSGNNNAMNNFGKARTVLGVPDGKKVTFHDVAGADEEKEELAEVVDFLRDPKKYTEIGARIPHGILLVGPPGTGKTLLARAVAGEADVQFLSISGSDFVEMYVGVGAARVRDLFAQAKKIAPAIIFIDEIDAVGRKRGSGMGGGHDEKEQTLNQLLVEMDGFGRTEGVIVLAATNRPDILDPALLRPGRFDRQIHVGKPDVKGREDILKVHAKDKRLDDSVSLKTIARATPGFTGADLSNLLNEAALHAVRNKRDKIAPADIEEARDKITMGPRKIRKMRPEDIKLTAYHEAGHAFVSLMYEDIADPIHQATIIPRGRALGMVQHLPIDDKVSMTLAEVRANLSIAMAGRCAEEVFFGNDKITTGAESDIAMATRLARYLITTAGLSKKVGLAAINQVGTFGTRGALENASEKTAEIVDNEIQNWLSAAHADATKHLTKNKKTVEKLATELLNRETLTGEEIREIVFGNKAKKTTSRKPRLKNAVPKKQ